MHLLIITANKKNSKKAIKLVTNIITNHKSTGSQSSATIIDIMYIYTRIL
jgi:hypothetical protein